MTATTTGTILSAVGTVARAMLIGASVTIGLLVATSAQAATNCAALAKASLPQAVITAAEIVPAGKFQPAQGGLAHIMALPGMNLAGHAQERPNVAFCRLAATLSPTSDSAIRIEVWLPLSGWNGKFLGVGNFGWAGSIMTGGMVTGLGQGYAVASTDTGHDGATPEGQGGRFALGHPQKLIDYAYRADHLMTVDAKAIIKAFYGRAPTRSYWIGCSLGGLEGLIEAKKYPADYDGIVAGAPPNPIADFNAEQLWSGWLTNRFPAMQMSQTKLAMVHDAVMAACATSVGRAQGFVDQPDRCGFDPKQLLCAGAEQADCLTAAQADGLAQIYRGPINPRTGAVIFPGPAKGSELTLSADGRAFPVALDLFKYVVFRNPDWNWTTLNWDGDIAKARAIVGPLLHVDADLEPFFARGGKLLFYIGWNDGHNPQELIDYYMRVARNAGPRASASMRLFTIPGMAHCFGGEGCDTFDKLGLIDAWSAAGTAPERVVGARIENGAVVRTRPMCAYPLVARYTGTGKPSEAGNFVCARAS